MTNRFCTITYYSLLQWAVQPPITGCIAAYSGLYSRLLKTVVGNSNKSLSLKDKKA
jgi:hypothetical protein